MRDSLGNRRRTLTSALNSKKENEVNAPWNNAGVGGGLTFGGAQFLSAFEVWGVTGNYAVGTSLDTNGFTVTWTRTGSPTGNADEIRMFFICFR